MIEKIYVMLADELSEAPAKPHKTSSMPRINPYLISMSEKNGGFIERVSYFVIDKNTGHPWGHAYSKADAISIAKEMYAAIEAKGNLDSVLDEHYKKYALLRIAQEKELQDFLDMQAKWSTPRSRTNYKKLEKKLPKRALVFQKNCGKCFYCDDQLVIDGEWHIEHKQPKSKGGTNDLENLVPACPSCNLRKKDKTAKQFLEESA